MKKDNGENDNVVKIRFARDSYNTPGGGAILSDKLDPVLFVEYLKQKKLLEDALVANGNWKISFDALQKLMKQWRFIAYMGIGVIFLPQVIKMFIIK